MDLVNNPKISPVIANREGDAQQRREDAMGILGAALEAVDPAKAVQNVLKFNPETVTLYIASVAHNLLEYEQIFLLGAGKAGSPMAAAVAQLLGSHLVDSAINVKYEHLAGLTSDSTLKITEAGHPIPDEAGVQGTQRIIDILKRAGEKDLVIAVISGGGSALLEMPVEGVTLGDLQALTHKLLKAGATINQMNIVRKHLSQIKGGNMARLSYPARLVSLILSDVVGSPLDIIASGPTVPDTSTFAEAWSVLEQYGLTQAGELPEAVLQHLRAGVKGEIPDTPKANEPAFTNVQNVIVGDNRVAALAAAAKASQLGYNPIILSTFIEGEAREVAKMLVGVAREISGFDSPIKKPACILAGGETTVTIRGEGKGGRNQEMALAAALALDGLHNIVCVPLATDGTDGPTDAAGAIVDGETVYRAREKGLEPLNYLERNDAYHFFEQTRDLLITGPTSTNVNDLTLLLIW